MLRLFLASLVAVFLTACSSTPKIEPRTVWVNGMPVKENCLYAEEQWQRILPAIGSDNIYAHTIHTSEGSYATARVADQTYICNRSAYDVEMEKYRRR